MKHCPYHAQVGGVERGGAAPGREGGDVAAEVAAGLRAEWLAGRVQRAARAARGPTDGASPLTLTLTLSLTLTLTLSLTLTLTLTLTLALALTLTNRGRASW